METTCLSAFFLGGVWVMSLNFRYLIRLFWGWVFPYINLTYSLYIGEDSSILDT